MFPGDRANITERFEITIKGKTVIVCVSGNEHDGYDYGFMLRAPEHMSEPYSEFPLQTSDEYVKLLQSADYVARQLIQACNAALWCGMPVAEMFTLVRNANPDVHLRFFEDAPKEKVTPTESETENRSGYVYLLKTPTDYWKIGKTKNPANRIETFGLKLPFEVEYECLIWTDDRHWLESYFHGAYKDKRVNDSEFFALDQEMVDFMCMCSLNGLYKDPAQNAPLIKERNGLPLNEVEQRITDIWDAIDGTPD